MDAHHERRAPEATIVRWAEQHLSPDLSLNNTVLDVAAGSGRHALWFAERGHKVTAIDRQTDALLAHARDNVRVIKADLEAAPWPLPSERFNAVVIVNYLWRPLLPDLFASVAAGGYLLYETFAVGNERFGRPRNPDFLLQANELRQAMPADFTALDFWSGEVGEPAAAVRQRLLARRNHEQG